MLKRYVPLLAFFLPLLVSMDGNAQQAAPPAPSATGALTDGQISTPQGVFFAPTMQKHVGAPSTLPFAVNLETSAAQSSTVSVGWTGLPKQTRFENWTLSCRSARLVVYADIQYKDLDLGAETLKIFERCGEDAVSTVGLKVILSSPQASLAAFGAAFSACAINKGEKDVATMGLRIESEHEDWGKC